MGSERKEGGRGGRGRGGGEVPGIISLRREEGKKKKEKKRRRKDSVSDSFSSR
jgi:hypothetical protein